MGFMVGGGGWYAMLSSTFGQRLQRGDLSHGALTFRNHQWGFHGGLIFDGWAGGGEWLQLDGLIPRRRLWPLPRCRMPHGASVWLHSGVYHTGG